MPAPCTIELFGTLRVRNGNRLETQFRSRQTAEMLAYMACFADQFHRREKLADMFWPYAPAPQANTSMRVALTRLREMLEPPLPPTSSTDPFISERGNVQLNPALCTTDKLHFETLLTRARQAPTEEEAHALRVEAVGLYTADLLTEYTDPWAEGERQRMADLHILALRRIIERSARIHDLEAAFSFAHRAVDVDPSREESHRVLMQLYAGTGRPAAVRQQFDMLTATLEPLGSKPSAVTRKLLEQLGGPTPPTTIGLARPLPPSPRLGDVPMVLTRLLGRDDSLAAVCEMLETPETRLVTITGLGGCGKTRLALAVARHLAPQFPGGAWMVPLADLTEPDQLWDAIAQSLRLRRRARVALETQVKDALRNAPCLLLLDNFEHLVQDGASLLVRLMEEVPSLVCLVTSQQRLRVSGEYTYALSPLPTPLHIGTLQRMEEFPSVALFVERARAADPEFRLTPRNAGDVARLCRNLDGLPLAIEMAAPWVTLLTPAQMAAQLTPNSTLLTDLRPERPKRHASLEATFAWSQNLLSQPVQQLFAQLAVFRGGWTAEAAAYVAENETVLPLLLTLQGNSLLTAREEGEAMRFAYLEIVRGFAEERLRQQPDIEARVRQRHAQHFLELVEATDPELIGPNVQQANRVLEAEQYNVRAALNWLLDVSADDDAAGMALRMALSLWRYWTMRGEHAEGEQWLTRMLARLPANALDLRLRAQGVAGNLAYSAAQYERSRLYFEEALSLARQLQDKVREARALDSLGLVFKEQGDLEQARQYSAQAHTLFEELGDENGKAISRYNLAYVAGEAGDYSLSRTLHQQCLTYYRSKKDWFHVASTLGNMVRAELETGNLSAAREIISQGLALCVEVESVQVRAQTLENAAALFAQERAWELAAILLAHAVQLREEKQTPLNPIFAASKENLTARLRVELGAREWKEASARGTHTPFTALVELAQEHIASRSS